MRCAHKLTKHGNSVHLVIPRYLLANLGWLCGDTVVEELLEDGTLRVRPLKDPAFRPKPIPKLVHVIPSSENV